MHGQGEPANVDQVMIKGERRAAADAKHFRKALDVDPDKSVIPANALREPACEGARPLCAHHQTTVIINPLAMAEQNHGILEILRINGQRMFTEHLRQRTAAIKRYAA